MRRAWSVKIISVAGVLFLTACGVLAQFKSQEISEEDGVPVLIKHLPDYENARNRATHTNNVDDLRKALGDRPVFEDLDFKAGTEAVAAPYDGGKLLIVEFMNPQMSIDADTRINARLAQVSPGAPPVYYRRIGNYNAFVFDAKDEAAAAALLDQVKYEKTVQWLGEDPYYQKKAEHFFAIRTADIFLSTVLVIVGGIVLAVLTGLAVGLFYFRLREQKRAAMTAFSDAGGMVRLNLDELTAPAAERLLGD
ncbi:MAG: hypothetical protein JSS81_29440 [Acidobacteria bacterium]|nr:hypothetical protein [Acidobacteriota bacterium]